MLVTGRENCQYIAWFFALIVSLALGVNITMYSPAMVAPGIMLPFVFMWLTSFYPAAGPMYEVLRAESFPCSPRMLLGSVLGAMAIIYAILSVTIGWA